MPQGNGCRENIAKGTGSSLADVSDISEHGLYQNAYGSSERIIQHPHHDNDVGSYHVRMDKQTNTPVYLPKFRDQMSSFFPQNSSRKVPQPAARAAAAIRRFSNQFGRESSVAVLNRLSDAFDLETRLASYESLTSENDTRQTTGMVTALETKQGNQDPFRWSRIRENLGRDPPKTSLNVFDHPLYRAGISEPQRLPKPTHTPHDEFLTHIPRLPFPLISLPEAAMLQHFRRNRGEEDHTEPAAVFAMKAKNATMSTLSSPAFARTPTSGRFDAAVRLHGDALPRPALALYPRRMVNEVERHEFCMFSCKFQKHWGFANSQQRVSQAGLPPRQPS